MFTLNWTRNRPLFYVSWRSRGFIPQDAKGAELFLSGMVLNAFGQSTIAITQTASSRIALESLVGTSNVKLGELGLSIIRLDEKP